MLLQHESKHRQEINEQAACVPTERYLQKQVASPQAGVCRYLINPMQPTRIVDIHICKTSRPDAEGCAAVSQAHIILEDNHP